MSGGTVTTDGCEFHYLYKDRHYTPQTTEARNLRFTNFKGMKDAAGNEIGLNGRTFPFSLYETDSTYNTAGVNKIETIDSDNNATVNFTTIQYTEEMVNSHPNGDFYYVIKEDGAGAVNNGVKNWDGEIRIKLHAEIVDNSIVFTMRYMRFASKEALDAGIRE